MAHVPICAETCPRNPAMEQVLQRFTSQVDEKYSHIVARFRRELTHPERTQETSWATCLRTSSPAALAST